MAHNSREASSDTGAASATANSLDLGLADHDVAVQQVGAAQQVADDGLGGVGEADIDGVDQQDRVVCAGASDDLLVERHPHPRGVLGKPES